jgi:hypothetical protein
MNRKHNPWVALVGLLLGIALVILCAGCGVSAEATEPGEPATPTLKPAASTVSVAYPQTPEVAQPVGFQMGDIAWIVLHMDDIGPATAHSAVVIAEIEGYLITAPQYCGEGADRDLMWELVLRSDDGRQCLNIWPIGDCYTNQEAAQAVADRENMEG